MKKSFLNLLIIYITILIITFYLYFKFELIIFDQTKIFLILFVIYIIVISYLLFGLFTKRREKIGKN